MCDIVSVQRILNFGKAKSLELKAKKIKAILFRREPAKVHYYSMMAEIGTLTVMRITLDSKRTRSAYTEHRRQRLSSSYQASE